MRETDLVAMGNVQATVTTQESPAYVRTSLAAAITLGLSPGRFYRDIQCGCINLLLHYDGGCRANCAYCGLARTRPKGEEGNSFIRVDWPTVSTAEVIERLARYQQRVKRVCVSMVQHPRAYHDLVTVSRQVMERVDRPLSALVTASLMNRERLVSLKQMGADMVGLGLDAASQRVFTQTRGRAIGGPHQWEQHWQVIQEARQVFGPFRVNAHLIVGIGETDREMVETLYRLQGMQVCAYLFSFYPEADSRMARRRRPPLARYRRLQLVKHLIEAEGLAQRDIVFDERGRVAGLRVPRDLVERAIESGAPFITGGCPDRHGDLACTRPFANSRPGEPFRNYPFWPEPEDILDIRKQLRLKDWGWD
jgi:biotin synthase